MKKVIQFSRLYVPAVIFSSALVVFGIVGYVVFGGFNMGVDFRAGINETVRMAFPAMEVAYSGEGSAKLSVADKAATLVIVGTKNDDKTVRFAYADHRTLGELAAALNGVAGVMAAVKDKAEIDSSAIIASQQGTDELSTEKPLRVFRRIMDPSERFAEIEQVRKVAESIGEAAVQLAGDRAQQTYMIRIQDKGETSDFSNTVPERLKTALEAEFGADRVMILRTDIVGAAYSEALGGKVVWVLALAVLSILLYAIIRFKAQFAIGAVLAILHDALMMVAFMAWTRMEFNTSSIAAILTILGFSINDTIVIFDRIKEDRQLMPDKPFVDLLDMTLTETLSRTLITSLTTLLAVVTLYIATTGTMKDFALVLIVGVISGIYSTIYIATAFAVGWEKFFRGKGKDRKAELKPVKA